MTENNENLEPADENVEPADESSVAGTAPTEEPRASRVPSWVTKPRLIATGAATAIFLGGGAAGYAVGNAGHDDHSRPFPGAGQFDRDDRGGFAPGQGPGGQPPGQGSQQAPS